VYIAPTSRRSVGTALVQQRRRLRRIELESFTDREAQIREVVDGLVLDVRSEHPIAIALGHAHVLVFRERDACLVHELGGARRVRA
jgi:hypothetical protein